MKLYLFFLSSSAAGAFGTCAAIFGSAGLALVAFLLTFVVSHQWFKIEQELER